MMTTLLSLMPLALVLQADGLPTDPPSALTAEELALFPLAAPPVQEPATLAIRVRSVGQVSGDVRLEPHPDYIVEQPRLELPEDRYQAFWYVVSGTTRLLQKWVVYDMTVRGRPSRAIQFDFAMTPDDGGAPEATLDVVSYWLFEPSGPGSAAVPHGWTIDLEAVPASRLSEDPVRRPVTLTRFELGVEIESVAYAYEDQGGMLSRVLTAAALTRDPSQFDSDGDVTGNSFFLNEDYREGGSGAAANRFPLVPPLIPEATPLLNPSEMLDRSARSQQP